MDATRASVTALATSLIRATHTRCDEPKLVVDPYADQLVVDEERSLILERLLMTVPPEQRREIAAICKTNRERALDMAARATPGYAGVLIRVCYTEDHLSAAVERGLRQYILVGAGFDTFAFRRPDLAKKLEIFEVDHAATQHLKRERLARIGLEPPPNLHFVTIDFESESIGEALSRSTYRSGAASFFAWLGVTPYLTRDANLATLRSIAQCAGAGSELVLDYIEESALDVREASEEAKRMVAERRATAEPFLSGFNPQRVSADLAAVGWQLLEDLDPRAIEQRYCSGRRDGLRFTAPGHLARAMVQA